MNDSQSLLISSSTFDELATALTQFSRPPTPDPLTLTCCCGQADECEHWNAWFQLKGKLEERLILAARVGQALLEKHDQYVRKQNELSLMHRSDPSLGHVHAPSTISLVSMSPEERLEERVTELLQENASLGKRLDTAQLNSTVIESHHTHALAQLNHAQGTISQLQHDLALLSGVDSRVQRLTQENEDLVQELKSLDGVEAKARRFQREAERLREDRDRLRQDLVLERERYKEAGEEHLRDAKARLEMLSHSIVGQASSQAQQQQDNQATTKLLETLVGENESLKRTNAEAQNMLMECREEVEDLRRRIDEGVEVQRVERDAPTPTRLHRSDTEREPHVASLGWHRQSQGHRSTPSITSFGSRRTSRVYQPSHSPTPPSTRTTPPELSHPQPRLARPAALDLSTAGDELENERSAKSPMRTLYLLSRDKGVQTDDEGGSPNVLLPPTSTPSRVFSASSRPSSRTDGLSIHTNNTNTNTYTSDTSSQPPSASASNPNPNLQNPNPNPMTITTLLITQFTGLLKRLAAADLATITERLKRHRLTGGGNGLAGSAASAGLATEAAHHISQTTISGIMGEVAQVRSHLRNILGEGEKHYQGEGLGEQFRVKVTPDEFRSLLNLMRSMFVEFGSVRGALNELELEHPRPMAKEKGKKEKEKGWMDGFSKLFAAGVGAVGGESTHEDGVKGKEHRSAKSSLATTTLSTMAPAVVATDTTVSVEFSAGGHGIKTTQTPQPTDSNLTSNPRPPQQRQQQQRVMSTSSSVMGIFAGARQRERDREWVVLNRKKSMMLTPPPPPLADGGKGGGAGPRDKRTRRMSRNLDAIIDQVNPHTDDADSDGEVDSSHEDRPMAPTGPGALLQRTLRPRGLSDSSIHTSFMNAVAPEDEFPTSAPSTGPAPPGRQGAFAMPLPVPNRTSVLQSLSQRVQSFASSVGVAGTSPIANLGTNVVDDLKGTTPGSPHGSKSSRTRGVTGPGPSLRPDSPLVREESLAKLGVAHHKWGRGDLGKDV